MIDGSLLQSAQKCFEKKSREVVKMVVTYAFVIFQVNATIARAVQRSLVTSLGVTV